MHHLFQQLTSILSYKITNDIIFITVLPFSLFKPFDILMHVQNIDQSEAGLTVNVEVKPEIRGEVDSVKLARLLTALGQVN